MLRADELIVIVILENKGRLKGPFSSTERFPKLVDFFLLSFENACWNPSPMFGNGRRFHLKTLPVHSHTLESAKLEKVEKKRHA